LIKHTPTQIQGKIRSDLVRKRRKIERRERRERTIRGRGKENKKRVFVFLDLQKK
jgi:hypothetical protein